MAQVHAYHESHSQQQHPSDLDSLVASVPSPPGPELVSTFTRLVDHEALGHPADVPASGLRANLTSPPAAGSLEGFGHDTPSETPADPLLQLPDEEKHHTPAASSGDVVKVAPLHQEVKEESINENVLAELPATKLTSVEPSQMLPQVNGHVAPELVDERKPLLPSEDSRAEPAIVKKEEEEDAEHKSTQVKPCATLPSVSSSAEKLADVKREQQRMAERLLRSVDYKFQAMNVEDWTDPSRIEVRFIASLFAIPWSGLLILSKLVNLLSCLVLNYPLASSNSALGFLASVTAPTVVYVSLVGLFVCCADQMYSSLQ